MSNMHQNVKLTNGKEIEIILSGDTKIVIQGIRDNTRHDTPPTIRIMIKQTSTQNGLQYEMIKNHANLTEFEADILMLGLRDVMREDCF